MGKETEVRQIFLQAVEFLKHKLMYGKGKCLYSRVKDQNQILSGALKYLKKHVFLDNQ